MLKVLFIGYNIGIWSKFLQEQMNTPIEICCVDSYDEKAVVQAVGDVDVVVTGVFTPGMGQAAKRVRLIQMPGAGYDQIHPDSIPPGTIFANVHEHEQGIAEWTMMMCLALSRKLIESDAQLRQGDWSMSPVAGPWGPFHELGGKIMGVIGLGRVGRAVSRLANAFGMRCMGIDVVPLPAEQIRESGLNFSGGPQDSDRILRESDFLTIAVPLLPSTQGLISGRELDLMKSSAYILNPARAQVVDERALFEALHDRKIAGAGLDVWYVEPNSTERVSPSRFPFHSLQNVIITSHQAAWTQETMLRRFQIVAANIDRFAREEPLVGVVPELSRA